MCDTGAAGYKEELIAIRLPTRSSTQQGAPLASAQPRPTHPLRWHTYTCTSWPISGRTQQSDFTQMSGQIYSATPQTATNPHSTLTSGGRAHSRLCVDVQAHQHLAACLLCATRLSCASHGYTWTVRPRSATVLVVLYNKGERCQTTTHRVSRALAVIATHGLQVHSPAARACSEL